MYIMENVNIKIIIVLSYLIEQYNLIVRGQNQIVLHVFMSE